MDDLLLWSWSVLLRGLLVLLALLVLLGLHVRPLASHHTTNANVPNLQHASISLILPNPIHAPSAREGHALCALGGLITNGVVPLALDGLDDLCGRGFACHLDGFGQNALYPGLFTGRRALLIGEGFWGARVVRHQGTDHDTPPARAEVGANCGMSAGDGRMGMCVCTVELAYWRSAVDDDALCIRLLGTRVELGDVSWGCGGLGRGGKGEDASRAHLRRDSPVGQLVLELLHGC